MQAAEGEGGSPVPATHHPGHRVREDNGKLGVAATQLLPFDEDPDAMLEGSEDGNIAWLEPPRRAAAVTPSSCGPGRRP